VNDYLFYTKETLISFPRGTLSRQHYRRKQLGLYFLFHPGSMLATRHTHVLLLQCSFLGFHGWDRSRGWLGIVVVFAHLSSEIPPNYSPICRAGSRKGQIAARNENHNHGERLKLRPISQRTFINYFHVLLILIRAPVRPVFSCDWYKSGPQLQCKMSTTSTRRVFVPV
jgi:hypothetical protein